MGRWLAIVALGACSGCAGSFGSALHDYDHGRYAEAASTLREAERDAARWRGQKRARYALYRGLTHLALGDLPGTARWLGEAKRAADADPLLFSDEEAGRLASAWAHLP
ncbi:MAG TPA: hypothetical protein VJT73_12165 [Polyangiaceae bacterium]|nr:hypothetical protein [Polyangiaceae bacterium]